MELFLLLGRLLLAAVLSVAGITKLLDLNGSRQAMRDFGLPAALATPAGLLLPIIELVIALALLPAATAWLGAAGALILLLGFIGGISVNLVRGRTPNCHCFGQLHSAPIGRATLIRNLLLALLAGIVVVQGPNGVGPGVISWLASWNTAGYLWFLGSLTVLALLIAQGWVILNLLRQNGRLLLRLERVEAHLGLSEPVTSQQAPQTAATGLPIGTPAPAFDLPALDGTPQSLTTLLAPGKPLLLIFSSATCAPCNELMHEVAQWQQQYAKQLTIAVINRGDEEAVRAKAGTANPSTMLWQAEGEVAADYLVKGTPSAVLVSTDGRIRTALAGGTTAVRELVQNASHPLAMMTERLLPRAPIALDAKSPQPHVPTLAIGAAAPAFRLPDLDGKTVDLAHFRGKTTLLLFWNPNCGFCRRMASDLQAWESQEHAHAPQLLLISTGTAEANQAQGLVSPILLDSGFRVGHTYGAQGTPSAILIDAQGQVASELVVGATKIMPLLTHHNPDVAQLVAQPLAV